MEEKHNGATIRNGKCIISVYLEREIYDRLVIEAANARRNRSSFICHLLDKHFKKLDKQPDA